VETLQLGRTDVRVSRLGVGAWAWGDTMVWRFGDGYGEREVEEAFQASLDAGVSFIDTAEAYGMGTSERITGRLARGKDVVVATKFLPMPPRVPASLPRALEASLERLQMKRVDLYQIHWPAPWLSIPALMNRLADAVEKGKARAVGVSNYTAKQMRKAHAALAARGVPLASNQVEYSLLWRRPEANGVLEACRELGVTLIAYSPLAMGALSGKYTLAHRPRGARRLMRLFRPGPFKRAEKAVAVVREVAKQRGVAPSQVALRWLLQQPGVVPIPGAKNAAQARENAGALSFALSAGEWDELERATRGWLK
jgi:aryl-alcohol dehydrogenase-like predicted oxidoreductase